MAIEIVDFPIKIWWFSIATLVYQRVTWVIHETMSETYVEIWNSVF